MPGTSPLLTGVSVAASFAIILITIDVIHRHTSMYVRRSYPFPPPPPRLQPPPPRALLLARPPAAEMVQALPRRSPFPPAPSHSAPPPPSASGRSCNA